MLTAHGLLPYCDYAYLQAPLQPLLFAPLAWIAGVAAWPVLRLATALLGVLALFCTWRAARLVAPPRTALAATALFACCDAFLFSVGTARNDALPAACLAGALWLAIRAEQHGATPGRALAAGFLLAAAAAAKVSYVLPALAYGGWSLRHRRHRPALVALGALPVAGVVLWSFVVAPAGFVFGVVDFPVAGPADFYAERPWKLSGGAKLLDLLKFLALGPALAALVVAARRPRHAMLAILVAAGLAAAALPTPTWRQYLLPLLPPLFVLLAACWAERPPGHAGRALFAAFALAGLAPTAVALAGGRPAMAAAWTQGAAIGEALAHAGVAGPVATLSPQFLPRAGAMPDPRFAAGPFLFRSRRLSPPLGLPLVTRGDLRDAPLPAAVMAGGEDARTGGDPRLDLALEREAARRGYASMVVRETPWRLWVAP